MQIRDIMQTEVKIVSPDDTIRTAAKLMADIDAGVVPVGKDDHLVGMLTDRDITTRAVARGKAPRQCTVRDVMSPEIKYVFEDETTEDAARNMSALQVRRLPVLNRDKRLVGIVSLGDLAVMLGSEPAGGALEGVSQPNG